MIEVIVNVFECVKNLFSEVTLKLIVVLTLHVHDELEIAFLQRLSYSLNGSNRDPSSDVIFLDVVEILVCN